VDVETIERVRSIGLRPRDELMMIGYLVTVELGSIKRSPSATRMRSLALDEGLVAPRAKTR
jgi:hypothetical protein